MKRMEVSIRTAFYARAATPAEMEAGQAVIIQLGQVVPISALTAKERAQLEALAS